MNIVIRNGLVVGTDSSTVNDVIIRDGVIAEVGQRLTAPAGSLEVDADGCWVGPGFVDIHTHLREPGHEEAENIESGARAAAVGGYTAVVAMPNTEPALDNVPLVAHVLTRGKSAVVDVAVAAAITVGRRGESLTPMAELADLGVRLFTDDGNGVQSAGVMRRALAYAAPLGVRLAQHCEDATLAGGVMNEGPLAARLGLGGRSTLAEEIMVARDIALVRAVRTPIHFLHLSSALSLALVAAARAEGLPVTCEVAPHHFTLDESAVSSYDALFKVHPPLRSLSDVEAVRAALVRGDVDAVATDHAPHAPETKDQSFDEAPAGMLGLEHAASLTFDALGGVGADPTRFFAVMSRGPAMIAQLRACDKRPQHSAHGGSVTPGDDANLVVFDPRARWTASADVLQSRARNTPYDGRNLSGRPVATVVRGRLVARDGVIL